MPETLVLYPLDGVVDVGLVRRYLDARPDTVLDPLGSGWYMLIGTWSLDAKLRHAQHRVEPPNHYPYTAIVSAEAERLVLYIEFAHEAELAAAYEIRDWFTARWPCRIVDEYGRDRTAWHDPRPRTPAPPMDWAPDWWNELPAVGPRAVLPLHTSAVAWRVDWPDEAEEFAALELESCVALVIGADADADLQEVVPILAGLAPRLPSLTGLALFDIIDWEHRDTEDPPAWHTPVDVTALLKAFPRLEYLRVIGDLRLEPLRHERLRRLWVHSSQPWADAVAACDFPALNLET